MRGGTCTGKYTQGRQSRQKRERRTRRETERKKETDTERERESDRFEDGEDYITLYSPCHIVSLCASSTIISLTDKRSLSLCGYGVQGTETSSLGELLLSARFVSS